MKPWIKLKALAPISSLPVDVTSLAASSRQFENAACDGVELNFSGTAFCLAQPIGGLLFGGYHDKPSRGRN